MSGNQSQSLIPKIAKLPRFRRKGSRFDGLSRGRRAERGEMNKTEALYSQLLTADPDVYAWWFEPMTIRISHPETGQPAKVTPDFMVVMQNGATFIDDVKGTGPDDNASIVRMKAAAELYPLWLFRIVKKQKKKDGGGFKVSIL